MGGKNKGLTVHADAYCQLKSWAEENNTSIAAEVSRSVRIRLRAERNSGPDIEVGLSIQNLRERIAALEEILGIGQSMISRLRAALQLAETEAKVLGMLMHRQFVTKDALYGMLYGDRPDCDQPCWKTLDVWLHTLRKKLAVHQIKFDCVVNEGYSMKPEHKLKVRAALGMHEGEATIPSYPARMADQYGVTDFPTITLARPRAAA